MNFRKFLVILAVILGIFAMVAYMLETTEEDVESDMGEPVTFLIEDRCGAFHHECLTDLKGQG